MHWMNWRMCVVDESENDRVLDELENDIAKISVPEKMPDAQNLP